MDHADERSFLIQTGKESLLLQRAVGDEYMPTLLVTDAEGHITVVGLAGGHPFEVLQAAIPMLRDMHPAALSLTADSYVTTEPDGPIIRTLFGNSLKRAFEAGTKGVSEALVINMVTPTDAEVITLPYTLYANSIEWGEEIVSSVVDGRMIDVLRSVWS